MEIDLKEKDTEMRENEHKERVRQHKDTIRVQEQTVKQMHSLNMAMLQQYFFEENFNKNFK